MRLVSIFLAVLLVATIFVLASSGAGANTFAEEQFSGQTNHSITATSDTDPTRVVVASGVNRFAVWYDKTPGNNDIFFRRSTDNGATWQPIVNLSNNPGESITPRIAVQGTKVYVVWSQTNVQNTEGHVLFRRSVDDGATWSPIVKISTNNRAFAPEANPQIAASGSMVHIIWNDNQSLDVLYRRSVDYGATFQAIKNLSDSESVSNGYNMAIAVAGANVHVMWEETTFSDILVKSSTNNGFTFGEDIRFEAGSLIEPFEVDLVATGAYAYATWSGISSGSNRDVFFARTSNSGDAWSTPLNLSNNVGTSQYPQLAYSGANVFVIWQDTTPGNRDVFMKRSINNGASFQAVKNISNNLGDSYNPQVAASGPNVLITWSDYTTGNGEIYVRRSIDNGATLKPYVRITNNSGESSQPLITAIGGNVYILWLDDTPGNYDIFSRRSVDYGATWKPVQNLSNNAGWSSLQ